MVVISFGHFKCYTLHSNSLRTLPAYIWLLTISRDRPYLLQMLLLKFAHVYTLADLDCIFKPHSLPFKLKQGIETL